MQKCENCKSPFSWRKIYKSLSWFYKPIECDNCGTKHKITMFSRSTVAAISTLPIFIVFHFLSPSNNGYVNIGIGAIISIVGVMLAPYIVRYKENGEEL
ncbi:TIGR04104 family putative zinc finger protein [Bacillus sp. EB01]|uniref:TIGR04104 family putative zinc finger protein n=1 Tax=Bacillus sp. EB01 TaxID=1347086 RepID=UPI0005C60971|nr:TIGR04104 family putative zinc finger protein [Bacillus sp. EB01]